MRFLTHLGIVFILVVFFTSVSLNGQVFGSGKPFYNPITDTLSIPEINIRLNEEQKNYLKDNTDLLKSNLFAVPIDVNLSPEKDGLWIELPKFKMKIWLLSIKVEDVASLNLILEPFKLEKDSKLFFYNETQSRILGAITSNNNKTFGILPLAEIKGNRVICELQVPENSDFGSLTISKIGVEPTTQEILKSTNDRWYSLSDTCHVNVNCNQENHIQTNKKATCRIIYGGTGRCTGTLLNNLAHDRTPYVITAAHCFSTEQMANSAVYYFNYESPGCENEDGPLYTISGSTMLSAGFHIPKANDSLDFTLVRLSEKIPDNYTPNYLGWDATGRIPDSVYAFHHPMGDVKKIAISKESPSTAFQIFKFVDKSHWIVAAYETGSTQTCSSGAGLIDDNNHLIGTLTSGGKACSPIINDLYQKLQYSYNYFQDSTYQLKYWLDPYNTGKRVCESYNSHIDLLFSSRRLSNFESTDIPEVIRNEDGWGYISGHSSTYAKEFAEKFSFNGSKYILGALFDPAVIYGSNPFQCVNFVLREGGDVPGEIIYKKSYGTIDMMKKFNNSEDSLFWIDFDSSIFVTKEFYFGYQIEYSSDTFAVKVYSTEERLNSAFMRKDEEWSSLIKNGKDFPAHLAIKIMVSDFMPKIGDAIDEEELNKVFIYPNPVHDQLQVYIKEDVTGQLDCLIYDLSGRPVYWKTYSDIGHNIPVEINLDAGIYVLKVVNNNEILGVFKVVVRK